MKAKKRVLFFYSDLGGGGIQRLLSVLSRELGSHYDFYIGLYNHKQVFAFNGTVIQLHAPSVKNIFILLKNLFLRIKRLARIVEEYNIDIVVSHSLLENALALLAKRLYKFKAPLVITFHTNLRLMVKEMGVQGRVFIWIIQHLAGQADGIVGVSDGIVEELVAFGLPRHKLARLYNPLLVAEISRLKKEKIDAKWQAIFAKKPVIISVGRLVAAKNYSLLIKAFRTVKDRIDCTLVILGEGEEKEELAAVCAKYGLQNSVFLLGWMQNPYKYIAASSLYVMSSVREGFPNVLIEAMFCGKPVVATDCNHGPREIIEHGRSGLLVAVNDEHVLAEAIIKVLTDKALYKKISKNSRTRAEYFSIAKIRKEYISYINGIIAGYIP